MACTLQPNRAGFELPCAAGDTGLEFWGNSFVADPFGQIIAQASSDKEEVLVVECDPAKSEDTRRNWPFMRDRRVDAYQPIPQPLASTTIRLDQHPSDQRERLRLGPIA